MRYALTLNEPNLLPADVKKIQLHVQKHDVRIAADSPMRLESKSLTVRLGQNYSADLKSFPQSAQFRFRTTVGLARREVWMIWFKKQSMASETFRRYLRARFDEDYDQIEE